MKKKIKLVQTLLREKGLYNEVIDGIIGPLTLNALALVDEVKREWTDKMKIIGAIQTFAIEKGIPAEPIDGLWGPTTEEAYKQLSDLVIKGIKPRVWRPEDLEIPNPNNWPIQYSEEFYDFYGEMGENLVKVPLPFAHKIAWDPGKTVNSFYCHAKVKESLEKVLNNVLNEYGLPELQRLRLDYWGGCYNKRPIRGGTKWSMHSWGIAVDYDPDNNRLRWGRDKASFADPEYDPWWKCWEDEGWISLGRHRNFDWMHVQAARI